MIHDGRKGAASRECALERGDLLHKLSEIEWWLFGFDAELRELQWKARGDFEDLVHIGLFHPLGADLAQDIEHEGTGTYGFDVYAGTAGFLDRGGKDRD
jgi:hypothetical protein